MKKILLFILLIPVFVKAQIITTVGGNGIATYAGDGLAATSASLFEPHVAVKDVAGNLYIADRSNHCIRKIDASGIMSTIAGTGMAGYSGDGGPATAAQLNAATGVYVDNAGNVFIADYRNNRVRRINTSGIITTVAGNGMSGYTGDGGAATAARLALPSGVYVDATGNVYFTDGLYSIVRKINTSGIISTVAGNGSNGFSGDGGAATAARLYNPFGIAFDASGNLYIADQNNHRVRKVSTTGIISTIAGSGVPSFGGDGAAATAANLNIPSGVAIDRAGNILIADQLNSRVRLVSTSGIISTFAGTGAKGFGGDGGLATAATFHDVCGVYVDASGNVYMSDYLNQRVRVMSAPGCLEENFSLHPINDTVLMGTIASFTVGTSMLAPIYQWQENTGTGFTDLASVSPYSGVTTSSLNLNPTTMLMNGYQYRCLISNAYSCADTSKTSVLTVRPPSELWQVSSEPTLSPNPASDRLFIEFNGLTNAGTIQLVSLSGQVILEQSISNKSNSIDISSLATGVYIVKVINNGVVAHNRISKI